MKELIIHIGFGKCASSSIQGHLTANPEFTLNNRKFQYISFGGKKLIPSDEIKQRIEYSPRFFTTNISKNEEILIQQLKILKKSNIDIGIISNEGLANPKWLVGKRQQIFAKLDIPIRIFMVVRPFTEFLNASWWQWGAFSERNLNNWLKIFNHDIYSAGLSNWLKLPNVVEHKVVDINDEPVIKFAQYLGIDGVSNNQNNISSSSDLLRFLINNKKKFKRETHSPLIEFILNEEIAIKTPRPPFVIPLNLEKNICESFLEPHNQTCSSQLEEIMRFHADYMFNAFGERKILNQKDFSMQKFLNEPYNSDFLTRLCYVLTNRIHVPLNFDPNKYLFLNPEAKDARLNPYQHYLHTVSTKNWYNNFGTKLIKKLQK